MGNPSREAYYQPSENPLRSASAFLGNIGGTLGTLDSLFSLEFTKETIVALFVCLTSVLSAVSYTISVLYGCSRNRTMAKENIIPCQMWPATLLPPYYNDLLRQVFNIQYLFTCKGTRQKKKNVENSTLGLTPPP